MKRKVSEILGRIWTQIAGRAGTRSAARIAPEPWNPPRRADLISTSWHFPADRMADEASPKNAKVFAKTVDLLVTVEGDQTGTRCQSELWTVGYLEDECRTKRFVWPRGLALIDEFMPDRTMADLESEVRRLCQQESAQTYGALLDSFGKYGWHEYEPKFMFIDHRDRYPPLEGELLALRYTSFATSEPTNPSHFGDTLRIRLGVVPSREHREDYEYFRDRFGLTLPEHAVEFEFLLCTPSWFCSRYDLSRPAICQHVAFIDRFDRAAAESFVAHECSECRGFEESEVMEDMIPYARRIDRE
jgi:hypothetical protein